MRIRSLVGTGISGSQSRMGGRWAIITARVVYVCFDVVTTRSSSALQSMELTVSP